MAFQKEHVLLAVYARDNGGLITYRGLEEWPSVADFERHHSAVLGPCEKRTESMLGWPDDSVHWLLKTSCEGDIGYKLAKRIEATY